jgi:AcrR family transcriptional regulator
VSPALQPIAGGEEEGNRERTCRGRVIEAARRVLYRVGAAATTLEGVAREAGTTRGGIYCHFASKEELILAVVARWPLPSLDGEEDVADPLAGLDRALCRLGGQLRDDRTLHEMFLFSDAEVRRHGLWRFEGPGAGNILARARRPDRGCLP